MDSCKTQLADPGFGEKTESEKALNGLTSFDAKDNCQGWGLNQDN